MSKLTQITADEIERLKPKELTDLLRILLRAEALKHCVDKTGIHVPHQITVADGGNDGEWDSSVAPGDFIFKNLTIYQCKATEMSAVDCANELFEDSPKGLPRRPKSQVQKAIDKGGAYVFFCRKGYVTQAIEDRIGKANEELNKAIGQISTGFEIKFLGANAIAEWVNRHSAAFVFACRCLLREAAVSARDFAFWSGDHDFRKFPFQSNGDIDMLIAELRSTLSEQQAVVRITGQSGLGKSRIAFEVFNKNGSSPDEEKIREALALSAVYVDMQVNRSGILEWVSQLAVWELSGIVVIDNCSRRDHNLLEKVVMNSLSKISILTLDYVPEPPVGSLTLHRAVTPEMMRDIVPKILNSVPELVERLKPSGITRIATFANGFPQIAVLTAEAGQALDLYALDQRGIAGKLLWGYDNPDPDSLGILQCFAAFSDIGRLGDHRKQLAFILDQLCGGISETTFNIKVSRFRRNRVIQYVGDFLMVAPAPLAVALAAEWLENLAEEEIQRLLPGISKVGLLESFLNRLAQLDFSERAQQLSSKLVGPNGPFSSAEVLNSEAGSRVFRTLAELNPLASLECLTRLYANLSPAEAGDLSAGRRNLVQALERLCWKRENFPEAARVLLVLASGENESWSNNATGQFGQLFHVYLSGTQCPAIDRLCVLKEGLNSIYPEVRRICIGALGESLKTGQFMRFSDPSTSLIPELDWSPAAPQDMLDYWRASFEALRGQIANPRDADSGDQAAQVLGMNLEGILKSPLAFVLLPDFRSLADGLNNFWPSARDSIKWALSTSEGEEETECLSEWLKCVDPASLRSRLEDKVCSPGWNHEEQEGGSYLDVSEQQAIALASELSGKEDDWFAEVDVLLKGQQDQTFAFGFAVAEISPAPLQLFERCLAAFAALDGDRNPQLLRGMIRFLAQRGLATSILEQVAQDATLRVELLVPLTASAEPTITDLTRIANLIATGDLPARSIDVFAFGGITSEFDAVALAEALSSLLDAAPTAAPWILHVAHMAIYQLPERYQTLSELLSKLVIRSEVIDNLKQPSIGFAWKTIVDRLLRNPSKELVEQLSDVVIKDARKNLYFDSRTSQVAALAPTLLRNHPEWAWPVFEKSIRDDEQKLVFPLVALLSRSGYLDSSGLPIWDRTEESFREWASNNSDLLPILSEKMPLFLQKKLSAPSNDRKTIDIPDAVDQDDELVGSLEPDDIHEWHPLAASILDMRGDADFLSSLGRKILTFGSAGSRVPYLKIRLQILTDLQESPNIGLREVARKLIRIIGNEIDHEMKIDAQREAGIDVW